MARAGGRVDVRRRLLGCARAAARRVLLRAGGRQGGPAVRRALLALATLALLLPANAFARGDFDPTTEFEQKEWVPIHLGPLNLSITKAVVYLILASLVTMAFGYVFMRGPFGKKIGKRET